MMLPPFRLRQAVIGALLSCSCLSGVLVSAAEQAATSRQSEIRVQQRGTWRIAESRNFSVWMKTEAAEAIALARECEKLREELSDDWSGGSAIEDWTLPCVVVVHVNSHDFQRAVDAGGPQATGCTTVTTDAGRILFRRIDLRQDAPNWAANALPHELSHVLLADAFPGQAVPGWLNEGLAMLAEQPALRQRREEILREAWQSEQRPSLEFLMSTPRGDLNLHYAASSSLLDFLIREWGREQVLQFTREVAASDCDQAARTVFQLDRGAAELQQRWHGYLQGRLGPSGT